MLMLNSSPPPRPMRDHRISLEYFHYIHAVLPRSDGTVCSQLPCVYILALTTQCTITSGKHGIYVSMHT